MADPSKSVAPTTAPPVYESPPTLTPRVNRASLPPVVLPSGFPSTHAPASLQEATSSKGHFECPACGAAFGEWHSYYGHVIAVDNKVCAWVQINLIDVVPPDAKKR